MSAADLQPYIEHAGIAVGAISGVLAAKGKEIDLFGVLVLALAAAFGGGTTRDVLVNEPVAWMQHPAMMMNALFTALAAFFAARWLRMPHGVLNVADALSLAFFVMLGTGKGLLLKFAPPVAVLLGVVTGVAGGIVRDVLLGTVPAVFRRGIHLYATAAGAGATVYVLLQPLGSLPAAVAGFLTVLLLRLAAIRWKWALPVFRMKE